MSTGENAMASKLKEGTMTSKLKESMLRLALERSKLWLFQLKQVYLFFLAKSTVNTPVST